MFNSGLFYKDTILIEELTDKQREEWLKSFSTSQLIKIINDLCLTIAMYQRQEDEEDLEIKEYDKPNM